MYEDGRERFSFKSFFLTILLVLLFIFIMLWLFPTKSYVNGKLQSSNDLERLSVLYDEIFANNVERMKDAAIGYFTNERMPQTLGESKKLTLQDMYDLHLILKLKDKNGKACDVNKSYTEMTKYTDEYRLKVNLSCGDDEDYIIVYLGCYNYCDGGVCEKRSTAPVANTTGGKVSQTDYKKDTSVKRTEEERVNVKYTCKVVNGKYYDDNGNEVSKTVYDAACSNKPSKKYIYKYVLVVKGRSYWTEWSLWQKEYIKKTTTREVETRTEKIIDGYETVKIQTGVKKQKVVSGYKTEKYQDGYTTELVPKTEKVQVGTKDVTKNIKIKTGEVESCSDKIYSGKTVPSNTSTTHYKQIGSTTQSTCSNCEEETIYTWKVCTVEPVYQIKQTTEKVPVYKEVTTYTKKQVPVYKTRKVEVYKEIKTPIYVEKTTPVYKTVTYYRYRDYITVEGYKDVKWSYKKYDKELIEKHYELVEVKEV